MEDDYDSEYRYKGKPIPALKGYDAHEKRYFAKKEDDEIYVIMKEDESVIKDYHTSNYSFFDYHFTFTKEEK